MDFAAQLRLMRAVRGMSQKELGEHAGIPSYTIPWIETGRLVPTKEYETRIREALHWPDNADQAFSILAIPHPQEA